MHDLVVSSSSAFAHGVKPRSGAVHICYCHTPFRYVWHEREVSLSEVPAYVRPLLRRVLDRIRRWDREAGDRVSHFIANSQVTRQRIGDFYGRDATVVHPPVEIERFSPGQAEDFFLVVTELTRHKRVEVALEAAKLARRPLTVVGEGPELERLRSRFDSSATFTGSVTDAVLADLYRRARAVIVPNVEEFGIAAVEAQASGRPVVALNAGGTSETVLDGETGVLVEHGSAAAFAEVLSDVDFENFSPARMREHASQFSTERFRERFKAEVSRLTGQ
jgi:glycosyltransferase involved in cell wall biosynthesis